jgi:L-asparaginase / beta-aspartyl-peptidase
MRKLLCFLWMIVVLQGISQEKKYVLVIHGGAGTILKSQMSEEKEKQYRASLQKALQVGKAILEKGGKSLDAVEAVIRVLEDDSLFNAGKGAVFTNEGKNELDASVMDGSNLMAGSVAGVTIVKNPITLARKVMEKSEHVMMVGKGAEKFAAQQKCELVKPAYFFTEGRWKGLQKAKKEDSSKMDKKGNAMLQALEHDKKFGTVGCVALDMSGNLAAGTSTGGMTNKKFGRVGDAPIIGCGTYADNQSAAVSCTGWGEYFIRTAVAKTVCDLVELGNVGVTEAAQKALDKVKALGGDGGLIAVDKNGNITMSFNTEGMYRGFVKSNGETAVEIYK